MKKSVLLLGLHCHQPVDNFSYVVDEAIEKAYKPFFREVLKYENFKFSVHYSGWLLEYVKENDEEFFAMMREASERGQVEFLTGGFYEPILASIPSKDRRGQIKKLNKFIKKHFGQKPRGLWLTERVWENSIIADLHKCGIEYVVVDDYHFISAGFDPSELNGYYATEEGGVGMKIFPINKTLRYILPFNPSDEVVNYIESLADERVSAAVIFDDGEKFGIWPKTYEWVYEKGWLKSFMEKISKNEKIETAFYSEFIDNNPPLGIAYLPTTSYFEMGEWSLRADDGVKMEKMKENLLKNGFDEVSVEKFVKGTIWKNFLVKYKESDRIHKRVLELSKNRVKSKKYKESLFKAQTNDVLWHGVFGGLYLPNLRDNAYRFIIECENLRGGKEKLEIKDINLDGYKEAKFSNENLIAVFDSKDGGQLTEFSVRDKTFNFQNVLTRYKEAYHQKIFENRVYGGEEKRKEGIETIHSFNFEELEKYKELLKFDWYVKNSFVDHISDESFTLDSFDNCTFWEYGDFANQPFSLQKRGREVVFKREGGIYKNSRKYETLLTKRFALKENGIAFNISLNSENMENLFYIMEHNFHFASLGEIFINDLSYEGSFVMENTDVLSIKDGYTSKEIKFVFDKKCDVFLYPLDTLSQSESGFEIINQGLTLGFRFDFNCHLNIAGEIVLSSLGE